MIKAPHTIERTARLHLGGAEFLATYRVTAQCCYDRGKVSGPPEDCYPPEAWVESSQVEILSLKDTIGKEISHPVVLSFARAELEKLPLDDYVLESWMKEGPDEPGRR